MRTRIFLIFLLFFLVSSVLGQWTIHLEEKGRYFLPLKGRLEPDPLELGENIASLNFNAVPVERWAVANFELGVIFLHETINGIEVYAPRAISIEEFMFDLQWAEWRQSLRTSHKEYKERGVKFEIPMELPPGLRTFIGTGGAGLGVSGLYKVTMAGRSQWKNTENYYGSKWPQLQMEQESRFTITGNIGSKIEVRVDQDSHRQTELENTLNIKYTGEEDDVIHNIEAGNTTLSLQGAELVGYSEQIQGLFGIKSEFQVGDWNITAIASQEKGNTRQITVRPEIDKRNVKRYDYEYKKRTYFYIEDIFASHTASGDSIMEFELYITSDDPRYSSDLSTTLGAAFINPMDVIGYPDSVVGYFKKIDTDRYYYSPRGGWFRLKSPAYDGEVLAVKYVIKRPTGLIDSVGAIRDSNYIILKLIKPANMSPSHPCWELEWRNVYDLGKTDIDLLTTYIKLFRYFGNSSDTTNSIPNNPFVYLLEWYGMDSLDENGNPESDGLVDQNLRFLDPARGELIFPVPHPFDPKEIDLLLSPALIDFPDSLRNPLIYSSTDITEMSENSHMFIFGELKGFSSQQSLGSYSIIKGSEVVTLNGEKLIRNQDYTILYEIGQIRFISDRAKDPNANIRITFEAQPFFSIKQKTLLGSRIKYELGDDSWFGFTGLYKNVTSPIERPQVGREPTSAYILDTDLRLSADVPFLTEIVDAIPLIQTDVPSQTIFKAEAAKLYSTPNTSGEAYIDDFESSRMRSSISIIRTNWTLASPPSDFENQNRAKVIWFNDKVYSGEAFPNRITTGSTSTTDYLKLQYFDTTTVVPDSMVWGGIMQYLNSSYHDQHNTQFMEIRIKGNVGILTVDIGVISEDVNDNDILNTEDKLRDNRYNHILEEGEDIGIDGLKNDDEYGYYLHLAGIDTSGMSLNEMKDMFATVFPNRDPLDPSGDNYDYSNKNRYDKINGTEGNGTDVMYGGRPRPDTEDINRNGSLDDINDYFSYEIDLSSNAFLVSGTSTIGGWRLLRIPIRDTIFTFVEDGKVWRRKQVGNPSSDFKQIKYIRLSLRGIDSPGANFTENPDAEISIISIDFVENQWRSNSDKLEISVISTDENTGYTPPPDVYIPVNQTTGITMAERSLSLKYKYIPPLDTVKAYKTLSDDQHQDYTRYKKLKMWVYLDSTSVKGEHSVLLFRIGDTRGNYYEYRTMQLENGWSENNKVEIDFNEITSFKEEYYRRLNNPNLEDIPNTKLASHGRGYYTIIGQPTLTRITYFEIGIINPDPNFPISGEIWCDELILTNARIDDGMAYKTELSIDMADFARFNVSYNQRDDDFHGLTSEIPQRGYGQSRLSRTVAQALTKTLSYNCNFVLGKFFPPRWNVSLPLSYVKTHETSIPRLKTGSDVVLSDSLRNEEKTVINTQTISLLGIGVAPESRTPILDLLVVPNKISYSCLRSKEISPRYPKNIHSNYTFKHNYTLGLKKGTIKRKKTMGVIKDSTYSKSSGITSFLLSKTLNAIRPTLVKFITTVTSDKTQKFDQLGTPDNKYTRYLRHDTKLTFEPFKNVTADAGLHLERDIHKKNFISLGPPFIVGKAMSKDLNTGLHWSPDNLKFLTQRYDFTSKYHEDTRSPQEGTFGQATQNRTLRADYTLYWSKLFGKGAKGEESSSLKNLLTKFDNLRATFNWNSTINAPNLTRRPDQLFQIGINSDPGVSVYEGELSDGRLSPSTTNTHTFEASSGTKLPSDITLKFSYNFTRTANYTNTDNKKTISHKLPDITANWGFINKSKFFKSFSNSVTSKSSWLRRTTTTYTNEEFSQKKTENKFQPFLGMTFNMKGGWTLDLRYNLEFLKNENYTGTQLNYSDNLKSGLDVVVRYAIRTSQGLKIPLLGKITLENNLDFTLNVNYSVNKSKSWNSTSTTKTPTRHSSHLTIRPQLSYSLSKNAIAGMQIEITNDTDKIRKPYITTYIRDVRMWVQFSFGGSRSVGGRRLF